MLFGSDDLGVNDWVYNSGNTLIGGSGVDRFVASKHDESKDQFDLLVDRGSEDIVG